jgi:phthiocerol/phenolphthiocerol synthesis type-I polyketide synthase D
VPLVARIRGLDETDVDPRVPLGEYGLSSRETVELSGAVAGRSLPTTSLCSRSTIEWLAAALTEPPEPLPRRRFPCPRPGSPSRSR